MLIISTSLSLNSWRHFANSFDQFKLNDLNKSFCLFRPVLKRVCFVLFLPFYQLQCYFCGLFGLKKSTRTKLTQVITTLNWEEGNVVFGFTLPQLICEIMWKTKFMLNAILQLTDGALCFSFDLDSKTCLI